MTESINLEFEAYVKAELGDIAVVSEGRYISPKIQNYYKVWQHLEAQLEAAKNQWIPVSERLPEPDTDVLCFLQFGSSHRITVAGLFPIEMGAGFRSGIRSEWLEFSNPDSALSNITHWMPLPTPPIKESK